ncbi:organic cation transporter protein-like [Hylaeus anthracinus]|uniref:organic cation transporter protein-like n=1 Tax=Hylaeus anthracinus TaxID=313031 RepID=UPI0023B9473F|nr:organic cation transporter protein-like [Hylaeus anthracinus]
MKATQLFVQANEAVTLDDVLIYLDEFGTYQRYLFCILTVFSVFLIFVYFTQAFLTVLPNEYWCKLPEVEGVSNEKLKKIMIPSSKVVPYEGHQLSYSRCWMYDLPVEQALALNKPDESWPLKRCNTWEFKLSRSDVPYMSVAAEKNWVCEEEYKATLAQSIFFVGSVAGSFAFGWLADKYGRIPALVGTNLLGFIGGVSTVYIDHFWQFCICRFAVGMAYDNTFVIAYILVLEYVGPRWRSFTANMSYGIFFTVGGVCLPWMAHGIANWRSFSLLTSIPLASVVLAPFFLPESVRWLISTGKIEKALKIITRIEKINDSEIPDEVYKEFLDDCIETADTLAAEDHTVFDLFKTTRLRKMMLLLTASWGLIQMAYDAHIRSLNTIGLDMFTSFTIASATELPAMLLVTSVLDILGRRWTLFGSVIISGLFSFFAASVALGVGFVTLAMCSRFFINVASNIAMQYAAELLPTVIRAEGVAFIHVMGYVTSVISPFIAFSHKARYNLPMTLLGTTCFVCGLVCLFLPETLMEQLPQTLLEGELFGIDQTFWETPFTRKEPLEPIGHHLHAKRPALRPAILRSTMISGYVGNESRILSTQEKAALASDRLADTDSSASVSPQDYLEQLRREASVIDDSANETREDNQK